jgi:hypothetical protein
MKKVISGIVFTVVVIAVLILSLPVSAQNSKAGFYSCPTPTPTIENRPVCCENAADQHYLQPKDFIRQDKQSDGSLLDIYICPICGYSNDPQLSKFKIVNGILVRK